MIDGLPVRYIPDGRQADGGFGSVFFCNDTHLERKVAIKVIRDDRERRRMSDEIQALMQMRSKHVVQVYDVIVSNTGQLGIVQEFIAGEDLCESSVHYANPNDYMKVLWQIASGIDDIHSFNIIHRDIKPNNIKLTSEGIVKIFDFGLARAEGPMASTIGFIGSRGYAAPELSNGGEFTRAVDVYAFGATALYVACRTLPNELLMLPPAQLLSNPFLNLSFPLVASVAELLYECLSPNPASRPQISEVKEILARHLLFNRHQALAVYKGEASYLNFSSPFVSLEYPEVGKIDIHYDGLLFICVGIEGEVYINNRVGTFGQEIPGSCVIALGGPARMASQRVFITFDVSYPEVVL